MAVELPVVFLAFANAPEAHLNLLKAESREVFRALQPLQDDGRIVVHREESSEFDELYEDLLANGDRLVIFHYGGHANGQMLALEGGGGSSTGLARLLGQWNSLKLVFLNGCATKGHVALLLDSGVPAVIATSVPIGDQKAQEFSAAFYAALAEGRSIGQAFDSGRGYVEGKYGEGSSNGVSFTRDIVPGGDTESAVLEWGLFTRDDCAEDLERWRLPDARADWRVQLVDARGPLRDMDGQPLLVAHRLPTRTVPAVLCSVCRTTSTTAGQAATTCPACGSSDVVPGPARTAIAEQVLAFTISADEVRSRVGEHIGAAQKSARSSVAPIRLDRLFLPYWVVDVDARTTFEAERGWNRSPGEAAPTLEWEPVREVVDLARHAYLVQAGSAAAGSDSAGPDWYWMLDQAEPHTRLDPAVPCVALDRSLQSAFDQVAADLDRELEAEVADRIGGHQRRNVLTDTRYPRVSARTVLLPHWYATLEREGERTGLLVNGQTGAVRPLRFPGAMNVQDGRTAPMNERTYEPSAQRSGPSFSVSVFSGVGIGLMVGTMLGLAGPSGDGRSIVGYFIAAVGAGLAALLGLNDSHFSTAKGLRIGAFGLAVVLAAPAGIFIRDHRLLAPSPPSLADRKAEYLALGYEEAQVLELLKPATTARVASVATPSVPFAAAPSVASIATERQGSLFSDTNAVDFCAQLDPDQFGNDASKTLDAFRRQGDQFKDLADRIQAQVPPQQQQAVVSAAWSVVCKVQERK